MKRQAAVIAIREVSEEYYLPVGVWLSRENARHAFKNSLKRFNTLNEALEDMQTRLKIPLKEWMKESILLPKVQHQKKLWDFIVKK